MAIQLATSGSVAALWSSPGIGRNPGGGGSNAVFLHLNVHRTQHVCCRIFDDQSCAPTVTLRSWLVGGARSPGRGWVARRVTRSESRPDGNRRPSPPCQSVPSSERSPAALNSRPSPEPLRP